MLIREGKNASAFCFSKFKKSRLFACAVQMALLALLAVPTGAKAQFFFATNNGSLTVIGYSGHPSTLSIPSATNGWPITSIANFVFESQSFTNLIIPNTITNIGNYAFASCFNLLAVTIGTSVANIGKGGFSSCIALRNVAIPNSVISIGEGAFSGCENLTHATIGTNVNTIGYSAFAGCTSLTNIVIPDSVTNLGVEAFENCGALEEATLGTGVTTIADNTFLYCAALTGITIPDSVLAIGDYAFSSCPDMSYAIIGTNVANIGDYAFDYCIALTNIVIPSSATNIGISAFANCFALNDVTLGTGVVTIGDDLPTFAPTVFYLPGTTGWGSTFGGASTVLWNPQAQISASFGVQDNQFGFNITGSTNIPVLVEACTNLEDSAWIPLQSVTLTNGLAYFSDPQWTNYPGRFYRFRSP